MVVRVPTVVHALLSAPVFRYGLGEYCDVDGSCYPDNPPDVPAGANPWGDVPAGANPFDGGGALSPGATFGGGNSGCPSVSMNACSASGGVTLSDANGCLQCMSSPTGGTPLQRTSSGGYVPPSPLTSFLNTLAMNTAPIAAAITGNPLPQSAAACAAAKGAWTGTTCIPPSGLASGMTPLLLLAAVGVVVVMAMRKGR